MEKGIIGPVLPDNFSVESSEEKEDASQNDSYGPQLPQHLLKNQPVGNAEEVEDDPNDVIGPLPAHLESSSSSSQALNERAELLRFLSSIKVCFHTNGLSFLWQKFICTFIYRMFVPMNHPNARSG